MDAGTPIDDLDWAELEQRYNAKMLEFDEKENAVYQDLHKLNSMFEVWAGAGQAKENDRASKRLKTRATYVQNEEKQLHEKREHYLHVVNAFKSALNLLDR